MLRPSIIAAALAVFPAHLANAQVGDITSGRSEASYNYFSLTPSYERPMTAEDMRRNEIEQKYREVVRTKIPDKKASNDPWKTVRQAPVAPARFERHRVE